MDKPLDQKQLEKQLEWLDNERRNDKTLIASLQSKLEKLDSENASLRERLTDMESEITRLNTLMARLSQFEQDVSSIQTNVDRQIDDFKGSIQENHIKANRNQQQLNDLDSDIQTLRKRIQQIEEIDFKKVIETHQNEDMRLARMNEELRAEVNEISHFDEDYQRSLRMIEESLRQDTKRITDIQGEIASLRKRNEETRAKQDLVGDNMRKLETRIKGMLDAESERRETQTAFIEKLNLSQVERDRIFKQWAERFDSMEGFSTGLEEKITGLEELNRSVKQSQAALEEVTQRFERRVNEITEVQRLNEDRFRQEWTTFKSDDQKRWSNYIISQDEQHREMNRALEALGDRITTQEELIETIQDTLQKIGKNDLKRLQSLVTSMRESIDNYNNIIKD